MDCRFVRLARTPLLLALPLLSAACSTSADYPSLSLRKAETQMRAQRAASDNAATAPALPSADTNLTTRLAGLVAVARQADASFARQRPVTERAIAAAGAPASDSWSLAQVALSQLQSSRSSAMTALADLDQLYVDAREESPVTPSPKAEAIATARDTVAAILAEQDSTLDTLSARLGA
ncbi:hypothetical protein MTR62_10670 [Novosphingobium sp. 1949]|uniref:Lipoprotein n=1 Tax=Novosphingobium organovorum TaxID=2930092 RepID=A0ABT0BED0_9SPHN|nr:hypothetical protein [Novosphingobium organovorum]MCJ2183151.1 hypothetical protein [Novosphingobium organovorum]